MRLRFFTYHRSLSLSLSLLLAAGFVIAQKPNGHEKKMVKSITAHINYLASDKLEGRGSGSEGEQLSAAYIAKEFKTLGLSPKGEDGYFQNLEIVTLRMAQDQTSLKIDDKVYTLFKDFYPLSISSDDGIANADIVDLGYGIEDLEANQDDYRGKNVGGKIALINMGSPDGIHPHSKFAAWMGSERRAKLAMQRGATAILFYHSDKSAERPSGALKKNAAKFDRPVFFVEILDDQKDLKSADLAVNILSMGQKASNVIGFKDYGAPTTIVIGAHHDHLGRGESGGSLAKESGEIHNGADDNASGVAATIELARIVSNDPKTFNKHNYLFIAFTAEEMGLLGSKYFVNNPTIDLSTINFMINMDMIGKLDSTKKVLAVNGMGTSPAWNKMLENNPADGKKIAKIKTTDGGIGASDHTSFYLKKIPAVHFFTGQHKHYHKPTDDVEIVNYVGEAYVISYICSWLETAQKWKRFEFKETTEDDQAGRMSFKVTLGVVPDYIFDGEGMRVDVVRPGRPGANAGMEDGDVVTSMNGTPVGSVMDYMQVLNKLNPGDNVDLVVKRGESFVVLKVKF